MIGATDNGKHIEALRTSRMKSGNCEFCGTYSHPLERHHEKYRPERCIYLCHFCHHKTHFRPYQLTKEEKMKLLQTRHGSEQWGAFTRKHHLMELLIKNYVAPGRRPAQLELRRTLKKH